VQVEPEVLDRRGGVGGGGGLELDALLERRQSRVDDRVLVAEVVVRLPG
jgi:hypothetical protein